jgi:[protein-PII] uridylyltransferase
VDGPEFDPSVELAALPPPEDAPEDLGKLAKDYLASLRSRVRAWHDSGAGGGAVVAAYTAGIDRLIQYLYDAATESYRRRYVQLDQRCTVAAQGGYGRAELNPQSDIDLLVLFPHKITPYVEVVTEKVLLSLFDARLQVGHAVRTVRDCVRLAAEDWKVKTSLIDVRSICGDRPLYDELTRALDREVKARGTAKFLRQTIAASEERHHEYGDSIYLLEPHLKMGQGGLRDLHTAMWVAKIKFKVTDLRELVVKGVTNAGELRELEQARDFVFRVRNALHFISNSHQDQLTFEFQEIIAASLGYTDALKDGPRGVERFMKDYYLNAASVTRFADMVIERALQQPTPYRLLGRMTARTIRDGVQIVGKQLGVTRSTVITDDPTNLVRLFADVQRHGVKLSPGLADLIRAHAGLISDEVRNDPRVIEAFMAILRAPVRVYETLLDMHKLGVLGELIPEWAHLRCLVQHDLYHIYTVDEHSLMGIRELERLREGEHAARAPLLTQAMREVDKVELLYLGMMLHDVGKGLGGGHSEKGAAFARLVADRLKFNEDDANELEFMVRYHLMMSHLAQRRDLGDDKLVIEFARRIGTPEALRRLYLLTYADMKAVGPKVWNNWKDMLVGEAYMRVQEVFSRGFEPEDRAERIARIRERAVAAVRAERGEASADAVARFLDTMPPVYYLSTPEGLIAEHAELVERVKADGLATDITHYAACEFSEFTVATHDRPGLFAMLTGVLAANNMNIVGARIATSVDGIALDAFRVSHLERREIVLDEERWARVRDLLADVLAGQKRVDEVIARAERPGLLSRKFTPRVATEVVVDNAVSSEFTVVDVYTHDRIGVLYRIASTFFRLGLDIHIAKITTNVDQVLDVFYVSEANGQKSKRAAEIREALFAALAEDRAERSASGTESGAAGTSEARA